MQELEKNNCIEKSISLAHHRLDTLETNYKELENKLDSVERTISKLEAILERLEKTVEKLATSIDKAQWFLITGVLTPIILGAILLILNLR